MVSQGKSDSEPKQAAQLAKQSIQRASAGHAVKDEGQVIQEAKAIYAGSDGKPYVEHRRVCTGPGQSITVSQELTMYVLL